MISNKKDAVNSIDEKIKQLKKILLDFDEKINKSVEDGDSELFNILINLQSEISRVRAFLEELKGSFFVLDSQKEIDNHTITDLKDGVIDLSKLIGKDSIVFFDDYINPISIGDIEDHTFKIEIEINTSTMKTSISSVLICDESIFPTKVNIQSKLLVNPSQEEIKKEGKRIVLESSYIDDYVLTKIPKEYLTPHLRERLRILNTREIEEDINVHLNLINESEGKIKALNKRLSEIRKNKENESD